MYKYWAKKRKCPCSYSKSTRLGGILTMWCLWLVVESTPRCGWRDWDQAVAPRAATVRPWASHLASLSLPYWTRRREVILEGKSQNTVCNFYLVQKLWILSTENFMLWIKIFLLSPTMKRFLCDIFFKSTCKIISPIYKITERV